MTRTLWMRGLGLVGLLSALACVFYVQPTDVGAKQETKGKKVALLVGVTDYDHADFRNLKYTENDVEALAEILGDKKKGGFDEVRVLSHSRAKTDKKVTPTAANVKAALEELLAKRTRHDTVLLALAGHGARVEVKDPDGEGRPRTFPYFCPTDADLLGISYRTGLSKSLVNLDELFEKLKQCGAGTKLVLMDACRNELEAKGATRKLGLTDVAVPRGVAALFSCSEDETAWESPKLKHGVFFHYVLEGLRGGAKNDDGEVTWARLSEYVRRQVPRNVPKIIGDGASQTPHELGNTRGESPVLSVIAPNTEKSKIVPKPIEPMPDEKGTIRLTLDELKTAMKVTTPTVMLRYNGDTVTRIELTRVGFGPSKAKADDKGDSASGRVTKIEDDSITIGSLSKAKDKGKAEEKSFKISKSVSIIRSGKADDKEQTTTTKAAGTSGDIRGNITAIEDDSFIFRVSVPFGSKEKSPEVIRFKTAKNVSVTKYSSKNLNKVTLDDLKTAVRVTGSVLVTVKHDGDTCNEIRIGIPPPSKGKSEEKTPDAVPDDKATNQITLNELKTAVKVTNPLVRVRHIGDTATKIEMGVGGPPRGKADEKEESMLGPITKITDDSITLGRFAKGKGTSEEKTFKISDSIAITRAAKKDEKEQFTLAKLATTSGETRGSLTAVEDDAIILRVGGTFKEKSAEFFRIKTSKDIKITKSVGKDKADVTLSRDELKTAVRVTGGIVVIVKHDRDTGNEIKIASSIFDNVGKDK